MSEAPRAERWVLTGRVQGVGFRYFTRGEAQALGLAGWVRNRADGAVELVVEGDEEAVRRFETALREGPPGARVDRLDREPAEATGAASFEIVR